MHEVSETRPGPGGYLNVSGYTDRPLPLAWGFESPQYQGVANASAAAEARSNLFGALMQAIREQPELGKRLGLPPFIVPTPPYNFQQAKEHSKH